jgi:glycosidase
MTNIRFPSMADYRDVETMNFHSSAIANGLSLDVIMAAVYAKSRDNARTPIQWSGSLPYGGFSNSAAGVTPWIGVNPNYTDINVEDALRDPQSIYYYYQKLLQLRRIMSVIVHGKYDILHDEDTHIFMYRRYDENNNEIIVACNFSEQPMRIDDIQLADRLSKHGHLLISNYDERKSLDYLGFRSYEAWAIEVKQS